MGWWATVHGTVARKEGTAEPKTWGRRQPSAGSGGERVERVREAGGAGDTAGFAAALGTWQPGELGRPTNQNRRGPPSAWVTNGAAGIRPNERPVRAVPLFRSPTLSLAVFTSSQFPRLRQLGLIADQLRERRSERTGGPSESLVAASRGSLAETPERDRPKRVVELAICPASRRLLPPRSRVSLVLTKGAFALSVCGQSYPFRRPLIGHYLCGRRWVSHGDVSSQPRCCCAGRTEQRVHGDR